MGLLHCPKDCNNGNSCAEDSRNEDNIRSVRAVANNETSYDHKTSGNQRRPGGYRDPGQGCCMACEPSLRRSFCRLCPEAKEFVPIEFAASDLSRHHPERPGEQEQRRSKTTAAYDWPHWASFPSRCTPSPCPLPRPADAKCLGVPGLGAQISHLGPEKADRAASVVLNCVHGAQNVPRSRPGRQGFRPPANASGDLTWPRFPIAAKSRLERLSECVPVGP